MAGILINSENKYLWNGFGLMSAYPSTGVDADQLMITVPDVSNFPYGIGSSNSPWMQTIINWNASPTASARAMKYSNNGYVYQTSYITSRAQSTTSTVPAAFTINVSGLTTSQNNKYNIVVYYNKECTSLRITQAGRKNATGSTKNGTISASIAADASSRFVHLTATLEEAISGTGNWSASGVWEDVTPSGVNNHVYVPRATYYSGYDYGTSRSASVITNNNMWFSDTAGAYTTASPDSSESSYDIRLQQGFVMPFTRDSGEFSLSAKFTSQGNHRFAILQPGWVYEVHNEDTFSINRYGSSQSVTNSSSPSGNATSAQSGVFGPASVTHPRWNWNNRQYPYISATGTGNGTWTATGTGYLGWLEASGIRVVPV